MCLREIVPANVVAESSMECVLVPLFFMEVGKWGVLFVT